MNFLFKRFGKLFGLKFYNTSVIVGTSKEKEELFPQQGNNFVQAEVGLLDPQRVGLHYLILRKYMLISGLIFWINNFLKYTINGDYLHHFPNYT